MAFQAFRPCPPPPICHLPESLRIKRQGEPGGCHWSPVTEPRVAQLVPSAGSWVCLKALGSERASAL